MILEASSSRRALFCLCKGEGGVSWVNYMGERAGEKIRGGYLS